MKIYLYHKVDRGFYESAYASWRAQGGRFGDHLLRMQHTLYSWKREFERQGCEVVVDLRSSYLMPQTLRCYLPLPLARLVRGGLWVTKIDPWLLQRDILRRIAHYKPDVAFFVVGGSIWASTLRELRRRRVPLVEWNGTPAGLIAERDRRNLPYWDLIFQPANLGPGLRAAGATGRIEYVPIGVDPEVHRPLQLTAEEYQKYQSDVCFIGGLGTAFHSQRRALVEYAVEQGVKMKIWGGYREHFTDSPILRCWQGQIWGEEQVKAMCASKIGLNFHGDIEPAELAQGLNVRAFELPACGVFQLMERVPSVSEFFEEDKEIVCFESKEEMIDKIRFYLTHETDRRRIAEAGKRRVLSEDTWRSRVHQMLSHLEKLVTVDGI